MAKLQKYVKTMLLIKNLTIASDCLLVEVVISLLEEVIIILSFVWASLVDLVLRAFAMFLECAGTGSKDFSVVVLLSSSLEGLSLNFSVFKFVSGLESLKCLYSITYQVLF